MAEHCYVEFKIFSGEKFERLSVISKELNDCKNSSVSKHVDVWREHFNADELNHFNRLSEKQNDEWKEFWFATPLPKRHSKEMPSPKWHFESMIEAILNGDYNIVGVKVLNENKARLEIEPFGWPYGGLNSLRALVRCFGHTIIGFHDGTQYYNGDPQPPLWLPASGI